MIESKYAKDRRENQCQNHLDVDPEIFEETPIRSTALLPLQAASSNQSGS
jgi:hypothetical protein